MTTTSLHGSSSSSSFVALKKEKKDNKNPPCLAIASEGVGCRRCRGCRRRQTMTTSLHGSSSSFVDLKKKMIKTHPVSQLQARGWVVDVVVGADGDRRQQRAYMARRRRRRSLT